MPPASPTTGYTLKHTKVPRHELTTLESASAFSVLGLSGCSAIGIAAAAPHAQWLEDLDCETRFNDESTQQAVQQDFQSFQTSLHQHDRFVCAFFVYSLQRRQFGFHGGHPPAVHLREIFFRFYEQPEFNTEIVMTILEMIYKRLTRLFAKKGYVIDGGPVSGDDDDVEANLPMPFRPRDPKAYRRKRRLLANPLYQLPDPDVMSVQGWCNVRYRWFSLHAAVKIEGADRAGLRQLFHLFFVGVQDHP